MEPIYITGVQTTPARVDELHEEILHLLKSKKKSFVLSGNVHGVNLARRNPWLKQFYNEADIVRVDGAGIVWAARLLGHKIPPRATWGDWGWQLAKFCSEKKISLYFLGGKEGSAEKTAQLMRRNNPDIKIAGVRNGYFDRNGSENEQVIKEINEASPDILIVGLGMPVQEKWILENCDAINAKVFITAGAAFEYLSGNFKRCPKWMGDAGFEWLFRLMLEPKRMATRYMIGNITFFIAVFRQIFIHQDNGIQEVPIGF